MSDPKSGDAAGIISAIASLVSALAWPVLVGLVLYAIYRHSDSIAGSLDRLMEGKSSAKIGLSPTGGFTFELVEQAATASANAVLESAKKSSTGPLDATQASQVARSAQTAATELASNPLEPQKRLRVLWVDDHPENNIDLQFAFQVLGIIVICLDSDEGIAPSFAMASGFDIVISDMGRDEMANGRRPALPQGGLSTVDAIRKDHPNVPVIIYAGTWAADHRDDNLVPPVIKITNYPQEVYQTVVNLAKEKARKDR